MCCFLLWGEFMNKIKDIEECEIRKCVDGTIKCCEYKKEKRK